MGDLHALIGLARRDITPPPGLRNRLWGAAASDIPTGVHRALSIDVVVVTSLDRNDTYVLATADVCEWRSVAEQMLVREALAAGSGARLDRVLLQSTHTHSAAAPCLDDVDLPGGAQLPEYLRAIVAAAGEAAAHALAAQEPSILSWSYGASTLATHRDLAHHDRMVVGWNPDVAADTTVAVGRVASPEGVVRGVLVNYACHPTVLGWQNTLVSPDFVGALRSHVESRYPDALCMFLQGASGELAPATQYTSSPAHADAAGRSLAASVEACLELMAAPGERLTFDGVVESGAPLGVWRHAEQSLRQDCAHISTIVTLERQTASIPGEALDDRVAQEREARAAKVAALAGDRQVIDYEVTVWTWGEAIIVSHPGEAYSWLQTMLRERFAPRPVIVMNLTNGAGAFYLPPRDAYRLPSYTVGQTPAAAGSLEAVADVAITMVDALQQ